MNNPLQYGGVWDNNYFSNYYSRYLQFCTAKRIMKKERGKKLCLILIFTEIFAALVVPQILTASGASVNVTLASSRPM